MDPKEIRFKEHVGIVTSDTTIGQFNFFVTPLMNKIGVGKEDYVMIDHPLLGGLCPLLAVVKELRNYEEIIGTSIRENKSVKTMAVGEIIGYVDLREPQIKSLRELVTPPKPGSKVFLPYLEFLEDIFLRTHDGKPFDHPVHMGKLESNANSRGGGLKPLNFYINSTDFTTQHFLISAISGSGKTHTVTVIIEELANKTGLPVVILDPYSEYTAISLAGKNIKKLMAENQLIPNDYPFDFEVSIHAFDDERVIKELEKSRIDLRAHAKLTVKPFFDQLTKTSEDQFELKMKDELKGEVRKKRVTILDSKGLLLEERRHLFTSCVKALWRNRLDGFGEPFLLVVEGALELEMEILRIIASEGRKLGITMCLLTQHPTEIDRRILSQMGTYVMGRTTDTTDLEYFRNMAMVKSALLAHLRPGEWIVNSINLNRPIKVFVRDRYSAS